MNAPSRIARGAVAAMLALACAPHALHAQGASAPSYPFPFTPIQVGVGEVRLTPELEGLKTIAGLEVVTLTGVPDAAGRLRTLDLRRASVVFEPGCVRVNGVPQVEIVPPGTSFWRGRVRGLESSDAFLALSPYGTRGWFGAAEEKNHLLAEPVGGDWAQTTLRVVDEATLAVAGSAPSFRCDALYPPGRTPVAVTDPGSQSSGGPQPNFFVPIAFETAYEFTRIFQGNPFAAQAYAQALIAAISDQYDRQIGAVFRVPYLNFYTLNIDPWTPASCGTMLNQFRSAWDNGAAPVPAALYHLMTGYDCGGGVAYVDVLCSSTYGFGVSGNMNGSSPFPPAQGPLTWDFVVVAHEIGHNFSAIHTHAYNPPIDGCGLTPQDCSALPGTLMSYCHGCPGGMNNIELEFHPRSVADMRAATLAANCLQNANGPNDECAGAVPLTDGPNGPFDNEYASTSTPIWPCGPSRQDRWFSYTATCFGSVTIETCGAPTNFDTTLQVFAGDCGNLSSIGCNDNACGLGSRVSFLATQGTTYLVRVGGTINFVNPYSGNFGIHVACTPAVPNDACANAIPLTVGTNGTFWTLGSTTSSPAWPCGSNVQKDVWFSYVAPVNGPISVSTCTAQRTFDTVLEAFTGNCSGLSSLGCNDDACARGSRLGIQATAGTTYYFRVGGYGNEEGLFELVLVADNDECSGAASLGLGTNGPFGNQSATTGSLAWPCGNRVGGDLWFRYTSTGCQVNFDTCTPTRSFDTVLEVFTGSCGALSSVGCNDDACGVGSRVTVLGAIGTTYYVRVAGYDDQRGSFDLVVSEGSGGGSFTRIPTACGGLGLSVSGAPRLGSPVGWQIEGGTGLQALFLGFLPLNLPLCASCTLGATIDATVTGSAIPAASIPCDPLLLGGQVYVQGIDVGSAGGCTDPLPFRLTDTIRLTIG